MMLVKPPGFDLRIVFSGECWLPKEPAEVRKVLNLLRYDTFVCSNLYCTVTEYMPDVEKLCRKYGKSVSEILFWLLRQLSDRLLGNRLRERARNYSGSAVIAEVVGVKEDVGSVRILIALFRLECFSEGVGADHLCFEVTQQAVEVGLQDRTAVGFLDLDRDRAFGVDQLVDGDQCQGSRHLMFGVSLSMSKCEIHSS